MENPRKKKIELGKEDKKECLDQIISYFNNEKDEKIGYIAAEKMLDFLVDTVGEKIYKKALQDVRKILKERMEDLEIELDFILEDR